MSKQKKSFLRIGMKIKARRKALGLTQEELADKINCSFKTIGNIENDNTIPDTRQVINLCDVLEMSFEEMFGDVLQRRTDTYQMLSSEDVAMRDSVDEKNSYNESNYLINRVIVKPTRSKTCLQLQEYIIAHVTKLEEYDLRALKTVMDCLMEKTKKE